MNYNCSCGEPSTHEEWHEDGCGDCVNVLTCDKCCVNNMPEDHPDHYARSCIHEPEVPSV